MHTGNQEPDAP